jgi:hypothetical protein
LSNRLGTVPKWIGLVVVLALAACGDDPSPAPSAPPASASAASTSTSAAPASVPGDPAKAVDAAADRLVSEPFKLKFSSIGSEATGSVDTRAQVSEIDTLLQNGATINVRQFGTDQFVQVTGDPAGALHATPGKWMHIDTKGLPAGNPLSPERNQAASGANLLKTATAVRVEHPGAYSGVVDLSRGGATQLPSAIAGKLKAVPFTAETDGQGRFTKLVFNLDSVVSGAGQLASSYYDYGVPVDVPRPAAGDTVPMPDAFKKSIGLA